MKRFLNIHPFFFGVYPVVAFLGHNIVQAYPLDALRPFLIMVGVTASIFGFFRLIYRDWGRAALATLFLMFLFLVFENVYGLAKKATLFSIPVGRYPFLLLIFGAISFIGLRWIFTEVDNPVFIARAFFTVGLVANFFPISQIVSFDLSGLIFSNKAIIDVEQTKFIREAYPDIYFIVLDSYARDDILAEVFNFDNSPFLTDLTKMGFYIPTCNQSNYSKTAFSIASALNLNYLDVLGGGKAKDAIRNKNLLRDNEVRRLLAQWGYQTISFPTGYVWSEMRNADLFLAPENDRLRTLGPWEPFGELKAFEVLLLRTTFRPVLDLFVFSWGKLHPEDGNLETAIQRVVYRQHFDRTHFALDALETIPSLPGPKFVYAHIVSPHSPYVLNNEGDFELNNDSPEHGYTEQLSYLNTRMVPILQGIIHHSEVPPIIILEGDHGAKAVEWTPEVMKNLSAYYFPEGGTEHLYDTITPINAFRIMFDYYFGTEFGTVEDISYNSLSDKNQLNFEMVPNTCTRESFQ